MKNFYEILGIDKTINDEKEIRKAAGQKWEKIKVAGDVLLKPQQNHDEETQQNQPANYEILGISKNSDAVVTPEEVRTAFTERQRELLNAYDCLINPSKRQLYNNQLTNKLEDTMDPELLRKLNLFGFLWVGTWKFDKENDSFAYDCEKNESWLAKADVLYAFVTSKSVGYIGKAAKLGNRLSEHVRKFSKLKHGKKVKESKKYVLMAQAIQQPGEVVRIFVMKPTESYYSDRYGTVDLVTGLEIPFAKEFKALWNKIGHTGEGIKEEEERIKKEKKEKSVMYDVEFMNKIMEGVENLKVLEMANMNSKLPPG